MILEITESKEIGLQFDRSVFFLFLNIGFSFATLQAYRKTPRQIAKLQSMETGFVSTVF